MNVIHYDTNYVVSLDYGKWEQGLQTSPNSQGKIEVLAVDDPAEYVRLMLSGEMQVWLDAFDDLSVWQAVGPAGEIQPVFLWWKKSMEDVIIER